MFTSVVKLPVMASSEPEVSALTIKLSRLARASIGQGNRSSEPARRQAIWKFELKAPELWSRLQLGVFESREFGRAYWGGGGNHTTYHRRVRDFGGS